MSRLGKRASVVFGLGIATGVISGLIWPGDLNNEPITAGHWVAIAGFLVTAFLLLLAAALVFFAVVGDAWRVKQFDLNDYFDRMKRR